MYTQKSESTVLFKFLFSLPFPTPHGSVYNHSMSVAKVGEKKHYKINNHEIIYKTLYTLRKKTLSVILHIIDVETATGLSNGNLRKEKGQLRATTELNANSLFKGPISK